MKKIILTGSNGQLGKNFVKFLEKENYFIYALDLHHDHEETSENIKQIEIDITNENSVHSFFHENSDFDILINNAGIGVFSPFEERTKQEFFNVFSVNLYGTFLMSQNALKYMKIKKSGKIINIGSIYGVVSSNPEIYGESGRNNSEIYSATKAGVIQMTKYLAAHYGEYNIQVNCISPGGVFNNQDKFFVNEYKKRVPSKKMATPSNFNTVLHMLITDGSEYINGQNIIVDGGFSLW